MQLEQKKIDQLVECFYGKLIKDSYYSTMFAEREVDIELLKSRQRTFISKLAAEDSSHDHEGQVNQVKERHPFQTTPERAEIWLNTMEDAMNEIKLEEAVKEHLLQKITFLMNKMSKKQP
ncbi:truncated hemoglobin YjbI [Cytobacillus eiseniae]|uniref:Truncated hemoglobin YjbI n=1 Tax=Cytobacillus eiseniae TaxID=762947 RepID=A0ABS4RDP6_9BACI|nr:hypothetical protein [Cytobacillus eiseniae]MBP2241026.1 truncated hemoglobin YjbI [Cytobacillus eiseniae]